MRSLSPSSSRRAAATSALPAIVVAVGVLVVSLGASLPEAWWQRTGHAVTPVTAKQHGDPCELIAGPGKAYCERDHGTAPPSSAHDSRDATAWQLVAVAAAVGALLVWGRRSSPVGEGRR